MTQSPALTKSLYHNPWFTWTLIASLVYLLLVGVTMVGSGFKWVSGGSEGAEAIFAFASNPLAGVILGILATALVQSSSTVTSVIVGLVAGGVPVEIAIPMIMGANMGTTITNTIVSLGNVREKAAFGKSFQAATVHDFFNLYSILIFLPIEILFHPLQKSAAALADLFVGDADASMSSFNFIGAITKPVAKTFAQGAEVLPGNLGGFVIILLGIAMIFASVIYLGKTLRAVMTHKAKDLLERAVGRSKFSGIVSGTVVTVLVQSSSTTTSLVVPLAGAGILTTRQIFPFTMGANIGTCITALLAATAISGAGAEVALQIALVHLLYNVFGVLLFSVTPWLKDLPIRSAEALGTRVAKNRVWAMGYIFGIFFLLPGAVFAGEMAFGKRPEHGAPASSLESVERKVEQENVNLE